MWPRPQDLKQLRSFLRFSGYYRRFLKHYSTMVKPFTDLISGYPPMHKNATRHKLTTIQRGPSWLLDWQVWASIQHHHWKAHHGSCSWVHWSLWIFDLPECWSLDRDIDGELQPRGQLEIRNLQRIESLDFGTSLHTHTHHQLCDRTDSFHFLIGLNSTKTGTVWTWLKTRGNIWTIKHSCEFLFHFLLTRVRTVS